MTELPDVTLICVDTVNHGEAIFAIEKSLEQIKPAKAIFFTDILWISDKFDIVNIPTLTSKADYSRWILKELGKQDISTSHILIIQADGYVLNGNCWDPKFLETEYIGAAWQYSDGRNVGNGGFSLRSMRLHQIISNDDFFYPSNPEDDFLCRTCRHLLELKYGVVFANEELADKFSYELNEPHDYTFGFHGKFFPPYRETIVIKRTMALGDVIQVEPVLEYFHEKKYRVVLDSMPSFLQFFEFHRYKIENYANFNKDIRHRVINLDMAYEVQPKQLHLKSYFEACGITDYKLRNAQIDYKVSGEHRLIKEKYVVIHIDRRETAYRNIFGVDFTKVRHYLESKGYQVIQIGRNEHELAGIELNTISESLLMWVIAGCEFFIGVDSGPAHVAVALRKRCFLFFGSVNPEYIYPDLSNISVLQSECPISKQHCWHSEMGTAGVECEVDKKRPPCCINSAESLIDKIRSIYG